MPAAASTDTPSAGRTLRLAVALPARDARGDAVDHLRTSPDGQALDRELFQVLLATDGAGAELDRRLAALLARQDRVVRCPPGLHERALCDAAARAADAELLVVAEHHCVAESTRLKASLRFFEAHPAIAAAALSCRPRPNAPLGEFEACILEEIERVTLAPGHWFKLHTDAFAMRRPAYFAAGGLDGRWGLFANAGLPARINALGLAVGVATDARVVHLTSPSFAVHQEHVRDFTPGRVRVPARPRARRVRAVVRTRPRVGERPRAHPRSRSCRGCRPRPGARRRARGRARPGCWLAELARRLAPAAAGPRARLGWRPGGPRPRYGG